MKIISTILVIILLFCGGALWYLAGGSLNEYVKSQIELIGHQVTEQQVTVGSVDIRLGEGAGTINQLTIPNPAKYNYPNAFTLNEITLDLSAKSLEPIVVDAVLINAPQAFVEIKKDGSANIKDLIDTITKNTKTANSDQTDNKQDSASEPKITVSKVVLAGTQLSLDLTDLGNKAHQLTIPDIELTNIGGKEGLPASQLGGEIVKQALSAIWKQAKRAQEDKLKEQLKDKLKEKAKEKLGKLFG